MKHATYLREALESNALTVDEVTKLVERHERIADGGKPSGKLVPIGQAINIGLAACREAVSEAQHALHQGKRLELAATVLGGMIAGGIYDEGAINETSLEALALVDSLFAHAVAHPGSLVDRAETETDPEPDNNDQ